MKSKKTSPSQVELGEGENKQQPQTNNISNSASHS